LIFRGVFDHTLDAKNRLTVPRPYQEALRAGVVLAIPPDRKPCIWIARGEDYERYTGSALAELSPLSDARLELERFFFGNSRDVKLDGRDRVMLPPHMLDHARLAREGGEEPREVVVVGAGERLECWERRAWGEHQQVLLERAGQMTEEAGR
jgi:MraZ protein